MKLRCVAFVALMAPVVASDAQIRDTTFTSRDSTLPWIAARTGSFFAANSPDCLERRSILSLRSENIVYFRTELDAVRYGLQKSAGPGCGVAPAPAAAGGAVSGKVAQILLGLYPATLEGSCATGEKFAAEWHRFDLGNSTIVSAADRQWFQAALADSAAAWSMRGGCAQYAAGALARQAARRDSVRANRYARAVVKRFADIPWYSSESAAVRILGKAASRVRNEDAQTTVLQYIDREILGKRAAMFLTFSDIDGFVSGGYLIENTRRSDCERLFDETVRTIEQLYPTLAKSAPSRKRNDSGLDSVCDALSIGKGLLSAVWKDTATTLDISVGTSDPALLAVTYETLEGRTLEKKTAWLKNRRAF